MSTPRTDILKATRRAQPLMGLLALLMLPFFTSAQVEMLDQVVAIVDDDIILASELQERVQGVRATMESRGVEVPEDDILIRETLDRLILDSIQLQLANLVLDGLPILASVNAVCSLHSKFPHPVQN